MTVKAPLSKIWPFITLAALMPLASSKSFFWWTISLRSLLLVAIGLIAVLLLWPDPRFSTKGRLRLGWGDILFSVFILLMIAAQIASPFHPALTGFPGKGEGLIFWLAIFVIYISAGRLLKGPASTKLFIDSLTAGGALVALFSLAALGRSGFNPALSAYGPLFNRTILGSYLAFVLPIAVGRGMTSNKAVIKFCYPPAIIIITAQIALSYSRAAWLGAVTGVVLLAIMRIVRSKRSMILKNTARALGLTALILMMLVVLLPFDWASVNERLTSARTPSRANWATRLEMWTSAVGAARDRPWFGWGPDSFALAYPKYASAKLLRLETALYGPDNRIKDIHNQPLQIAATLGLPAALLFLALPLLAIYHSLRRRDDEAARLKLGAAAGLMAYLALFWLTPSSVALLPLVFIVIAVCLNDAEAHLSPNRPITIPGRPAAALMIGLMTMGL